MKDYNEHIILHFILPAQLIRSDAVFYSNTEDIFRGISHLTKLKAPDAVALYISNPVISPPVRLTQPFAAELICIAPDHTITEIKPLPAHPQGQGDFLQTFTNAELLLFVPAGYSGEHQISVNTKVHFILPPKPEKEDDDEAADTGYDFTQLRSNYAKKVIADANPNDLLLAKYLMLAEETAMGIHIGWCAGMVMNAYYSKHLQEIIKELNPQKYLDDLARKTQRKFEDEAREKSIERRKQKELASLIKAIDLFQKKSGE